MHDLELCQQLLALDDSWSVTDIEIDEPSHRLDITIRYGAVKKKSFFRRADDSAVQDSITLRHLPIAGYRTYLHVPKPGTVGSGKSWAPAGSHFTHEMEAFIANALNYSRSVSAAAKMVAITPAEAREISERTGAGGDYEEPAAAVSAPTPAPAPAVEVEPVSVRSFDLDSGELPVETHPNWQRMINGEIPIQSNAVALQMLLQRVRQQISVNPTEVTRLSSARLLRQYFVKNRSQHQTEIAMLAGEEVMPVAATAAPETAAGIPPESAQCWQQVINGDLRIDTNEVGLQMMLERIRLSVERNPSEASRLAGVRILRQFFSKHRNRLQSELQQLGVTAAAPAPAASVAGSGAIALPTENHPGWMKLINGDIAINTDTVALQMMLERVRQSVDRNPSDASKMAGIRILRQFFQKHQARLQNEIAQLLGVSPPAPAAAAVSPGQVSYGVPAETDLCWQSLIDGLTTLDTTNVALQMMLERVRQSVERNPSGANITAGIRILRQFFVKHHSRLQNELQQIGATPGATVTPMPAAETQQHVTVPPESHPSWQRLIDGELELQTDVVALKMMLERIRISINNNPSDASRLAGAKILRQYFLKHQNKHKAELDQLLAA